MGYSVSITLIILLTLIPYCYMGTLNYPPKTYDEEEPLC